MYGLLICEDEPLIRMGLKKIIQGFDMPIKDIFLAEEGEQALQIFNNNNIQLVITDIEMPGLDGLDLLSRMLKSQNDLQCIIISGYNKFTYAQTAIKLGIQDYLLKPFDSQELYDAIKNCMEKLEQHRIQERIISNLLCTQIEIIWGNFVSDQTYKTLRNTDKSLFKAPSFVYLTFYVDKLPAASLTEAMLQIKRFLSTEFPRFLLLPGSGRTFWGILNVYPEDSSDLQKLAAKLNRYLCHCRSTCSISMYCGISKPEDDIFHLAKTAEEAENALCNRLQPLKWRVFEPSCALSSKQELQAKLDSLAESLYSHFKFLSLSSVEKDMSNLFCMIEHGFPACVPLIRPFFQTVDQRILEELEGDKTLFSLFSLLFECDNLVELEAQMKIRLTNLCRQQIKKQQISRDAVSHAIDYIEQNYAKQLDLTILANIVSMNYTYFSGIFKKKTGMNVTIYLQKFRIRKAKELLANTDDKIHVIAHYTGFNDERYFLKIFKRFEKMTPSEYRASLSLPVEEA